MTTSEQPRSKRSYDDTYQKVLNGPCPVHKNAKHRMRDCILLSKTFSEQKGKDKNNGNWDNRPPPDGGAPL